ncbi:cytochrome c oxidase, subunit VIa, polypeptide 2, isoform CRA_b [Rattus norvegicus]|uniref:Cytochrome c oxidase, subunit VIa, polypeptide 2, isoform CRA_b n=1 Tax=Rattus norvegicus TaxID=10116 RepID=A6I9Y8_RAT|nr:cytochrome c oxidase, subunit VIa, polypeptide 2, isoform CRA_b [Rattus norvegicus]
MSAQNSSPITTSASEPSPSPGGMGTTRFSTIPTSILCPPATSSLEDSADVLCHSLQTDLHTGSKGP